MAEKEVSPKAPGTSSGGGEKSAATRVTKRTTARKMSAKKTARKMSAKKTARKA